MSKFVVEVTLVGKATVEIEPGKTPPGTWSHNPAHVKEHLLSELRAAARMEERRTGIKIDWTVDHVASHEVK